MADELLMQRYHISIHPPLAGRDRALCVPTFCGNHFNPPAPCGAGPPLLPLLPQLFPISIHPPLAGRDSAVIIWRSLSCISIHPPLAGRDIDLPDVGMPHGISIHPPLAGRDYLQSGVTALEIHFNPPAPCGAGR